MLPREERICNLCDMNEMETEDHLLVRCRFYNTLRTKHNLTGHTDSNILFMNTPSMIMGQFLSEAFEIRKESLENPNYEVG